MVILPLLASILDYDFTSPPIYKLRKIIYTLPSLNMIETLEFKSLQTFSRGSLRTARATVITLQDAESTPELFHYNKSIRILGCLVSGGIVAAFCPSVYRFVNDGLWLSNPLPGTVIHPSQILLSAHALSAIFWTVLCTLQVILGSMMAQKSSSWFGKKMHIAMGRWMLPLVIMAMNTSAMMILLDETTTGRVHISIVILNIQACVFITLWACLGYYFVFRKQYQKH